MKKFLFISLALLLATTSQAENSAKLIQTGGQPGFVRVTPSSWGDTFSISVCLTSELAYDEFHISVVSSCEGLEPIGFEPGSWLTDDIVFDQYGAPVEVNPLWESGYLWCRCRTNMPGYENDGTCYGTAKWQERQRNEMAILRVVIKEGFTSGKITLAGYIASGPDSREYIECINGIIDYESDSYLYLDYEAGDVNTDGELTIADVTALIDKLL